MKGSAKKRRQKVNNLLMMNKTEKEIAEQLGVARQTVVRDVADLKKLSQTWLDGLAKDGFIFEYKLALEKIKETGAKLRRLYDEVKDQWLKLSILKQIDANDKLYLELLSETPTIRAYRKATKIVKQHVPEA